MVFSTRVEPRTRRAYCGQLETPMATISTSSATSPCAWRGSAAPDHAQEYSERDALLGELGKLPRRQRAVLVLRYYEDRPDAEIAELLGCAPGTVRGYASRALAALRVELGQEPPRLPVAIKKES